MADRSRRGAARRMIQFLVLALVVFGGWRAVGPGVVVVRTSHVAPVLSDGDIVWARRRVPELRRGSVVLVRSPAPGPVARLVDRLRSVGSESAGPDRVPDRLVPRIVAAVPGDVVTWRYGSVVVRTPGNELLRLTPEAVHPALPGAERARRVPEDSVFLVALSGGVTDGRVLGPQQATDIRYQVSRVLWPRENRGPVSAAEVVDRR